MTTAVSGSMQRPAHDVTLTDGSSTLGFVLCDTNGIIDPRTLVRRGMERTAIKTTTGDSAYSDMELPYLSIVQEDWSGGRGAIAFEEDKSKFYDSYRVQTQRIGEIILGSTVSTSLNGVSGYYRFLEYKRCLYAVRITDGANSFLFINGDRGAADSNSGQLTKLIDATKSWTVNEFANAIVLITSGPGSEETQPWRIISSNTATALTVSSAWNVTHTTSTEYVIIGSDKWTSLLDLGGHVTDFEVAGDYIYFARGETASLNVLRYQAYNNAGTWTARSSAETMQAVNIIAIRNEVENSIYLYGTRNSLLPYNTSLWKMRVPPTWESLYQNIGSLVDTDVPWADRIITNVTNTTSDGATKIAVGASFTTGVAAVKNLPAPVDITRANAIAMLVKSSVACNAGDVRLRLEDTEDLGRQEYSPTAVYIADPDGEISAVEMTKLLDESNYGVEYIKPGYDIYIGHTLPFQLIKITVGTGNNSATTNKYYLYSGVWEEITSTVTDGTVSSSKGLYQTGDITFGANRLGALDWRPMTFQGKELYWFRLSYSAVDLGTTISKIEVIERYNWKNPTYVEFYNNTVWDELTDAYDNEVLTDENLAWDYITSNDYLYIGYSSKFNRIKVNIKTGNTFTAALTVQYHSADGWVSVTGLVDGTSASSKTFAQDGIIYFNLPSDWLSKSIDTGASPVPSAYWVRLYHDSSTQLVPEVEEFYVDTDSVALYNAPVGLYQVKSGASPLYYASPLLADGEAGSLEPVVVASDDYIYVGSTIQFNKIYVDVNTANAVSATMSAEYFNGSTWTSITISDGTASGGKPLAQDGYITWTPENDWEQYSVGGSNLYWMRLKPGAVRCKLAELRIVRQNNIELQLPALVANTWTWAVMSITPTAYPLPDETLIRSVGVYINADNGAQDIYILDGVSLVYTYVNQASIVLHTDHRITELAAYNGEETGGVKNPWVFTEGGVYEIQTQNGDAVVSLPLGEMKELRSERTGVAWCVNGVYLYFSLGEEKVQRYYNKNMDDIGPDREEGLPSTYRGKVSDLLSYPDRVFAVVDAGSSGYSSILSLNGNAWSNVYSSATLGNRIRSAHHQVIPGKQYGILWFSETDDIKRLYVSTNPQTASGYVYASSGWLTTAWMYAGMKDVVKVWKSLKIFGENLSATCYVSCEYQKDSDTSWTAISGNFDASPSEEIVFGRVIGKRIRFRITLNTSDTTQTPRVLAILVEGYGIVPIKHEYSWTTILADKYFQVNLVNKKEKALGYGDVDTALTILDGWANAGTALTMNSRFKLFDSKTVVLGDPSLIPLDTPHIEQRTGQERYLIQVVCHDV